MDTLDAFHPSEYIVEEMEARGWDRDQLATQLVAVAPPEEDAAAAWQVQRAGLEFYLEIGPQTPALRLGETAALLGRVFGVSEEVFVNLERAWLKTQSAEPPQETK